MCCYYSSIFDTDLLCDWTFYKLLLHGFLIVFAVKGSKQDLSGLTVRNFFAFIVANSMIFMINGTFVAWVPTVIGYFAVNQRLYIISGGYFAYKVINTRREKPADALL